MYILNVYIYLYILYICIYLVLEICRNQNKDFSILTETHIIHDQMHHTKK